MPSNQISLFASRTLPSQDRKRPLPVCNDGPLFGIWVSTVLSSSAPTEHLLEDKSNCRIDARLGYRPGRAEGAPGLMQDKPRRSLSKEILVHNGVSELGCAKASCTKLLFTLAMQPTEFRSGNDFNPPASVALHFSLNPYQATFCW